MARDATIKLLRSTRSALNAQAALSGLIAGEPYLITDEDRLAIGTSSTTYETFQKSSEAGGALSSTIINAPYSSEFSYIATSTNAAAVVGLNVLCSIGYDATLENEPEDLESLIVSAAIINTGEIQFTLSFFGAFGGPIPIVYRIG